MFLRGRLSEMYRGWLVHPRFLQWHRERGRPTPATRRAGRTVSLAALAVLTGCSHFVLIESEPRGAAITLDGVPVGTTPLEVRVTWWAHRRNRIVLRKRGYEPVDAYLQRRATGWLALDIFFPPAAFLNAVGPAPKQSFTLKRDEFAPVGDETAPRGSPAFGAPGGD